MDLTTEQKLAINLKVARDMWPDAVIYRDSDVIAVSVNHGTDSELTFLFNIFDPDNTTDLNKAVEFYGLYVLPPIEDYRDSWACGRDELSKHGKSRNLSMQQAVTAASGANQTKEDE